MTQNVKTIGVLATIWALVSPFASAESDVERVQRILDKAVRQGNAMYEAEVVRRKEEGELQRLPAADLPRAPIPSPESLADQYAQMKKQGDDEQQGLLVFVSSSMPQATLELLASQAGQVGGTLVLRGFIGGMHKGAMPETMKFLRPLAQRGADVEINPEAFDRFSVDVVPTFAIVSRHMDCAAEVCDGDAALVAGDVSLDFALEEVVRKGGRGSSEAEAYLRTLRSRSSFSGR